MKNNSLNTNEKSNSNTTAESNYVWNKSLNLLDVWGHTPAKYCKNLKIKTKLKR